MRKRRSPSARFQEHSIDFSFSEQAGSPSPRCSILLRPVERLDIKKVSGHEKAHWSYNTSFLRAKEIMKTSTKDKIEGSFHEVKGAFKEQVGKATNDRALKAEGKSEKRAGKVQQQLGRAKDSVAQLKATLKQTKATRTLHK